MMRGLQRSIITLSCSIDWLDPLGVQIIYPCCWYDTQWKQSIWLFQLQVIHLRNIKVLKCLGGKYNTMDSLYRNNISDHDPYKQQFTFNQGFTHYFQYRQIFYYFWTSHLSAYVRIIFTVTWIYLLQLELRLLFTYIHTFEPVHFVPHLDIKPRL